MSDDQTPSGLAAMAPLARGETSVWLREPGLGLVADAAPISPEEVTEARARFVRFEPVLRALFPADGWDGQIRSELIDYPVPTPPNLLVKCDHALPMAGSVKARGGVYELLCYVEDLALERGLLSPGQSLEALLSPAALAVLGTCRIVVASTGNLGFAIGRVARALGLQAQIHMSHDAKAWKKDRLKAIGATVIEHACDYTGAVARARQAAEAEGAYFIDDEDSRRLFVGYAAAAAELADQLSARGLKIGADSPLIVYLPCGVGGAPGGITAGLKQIYGQHVLAVFVEPVASACVFAALAVGGGSAVSVYDYGLDNDTIADGLAVPSASPLVLQAIGRNIDAVVAVTDQAMVQWVRQAWALAGLRVEPSGASGFAALGPFMDQARAAGLIGDHTTPVHVVWTTGGSMLPQAEFAALLAGD
jgi:D-serine dehydratase